MEEVIERLMLAKGADVARGVKRARAFWTPFISQHRKSDAAALARAITNAQPGYEAALDLGRSMGKGTMPFTCVACLYDSQAGWKRGREAYARRLIAHSQPAPSRWRFMRRRGTPRRCTALINPHRLRPMNPPWMTLVAGIGIGTIVAALVSARMSKTVAIAGHRQAWINALRDHLSDYFHLIDRLVAARARHDTMGPTATAEARLTAVKEYRHILLQLNAGELEHRELAKKLLGLLDDATEDAVAAAVKDARAVLKREWEVTKGWTVKRVWRLGPRRVVRLFAREPTA